MTLVAIDDSETARLLIGAALADAGYEDVALFEGAEAFLAAMQEAAARGAPPPELVLLDVMMPGVDGIDLCATLRQMPAYAGTPIIMLTADTDVETLDQAMLAGADDYLTKPFQQVELRARVRNSLKIKAERDRRQARERQVAELRRRAPESVDAPGPGGLPSRGAFESVLRARLIDRAGGARPDGPLAVLALRADWLAPSDPDEVADPEPEEIRIARTGRVARALAAAPALAGDLLVHYEGDLFVMLAERGDRESCFALRDRLGGILAELSRDEDPLNGVRGRVGCAGLAFAGDAEQQPGTLIADAILAIGSSPVRTAASASLRAERYNGT